MTIKGACKAGLLQKLRDTNPKLKGANPQAVGENGYVTELRDNLIEGVRLEDFVEDLGQGGNELAEKFRAAHSSSALAVNTFAPFKADPSTLYLPGGRDFSALHFEQKCPHGVAGDLAPPNLDVVADGLGAIVAVASKLIEYLDPHRAEFSPAYERDIQDWRRYGAWFKEMMSLIASPTRYTYLDAGQLVKHAFGVGRVANGRRATLLYLFWEPANCNDFDIFKTHRTEVMRFADSVRGSDPSFIAMPYSELWFAWERQTSASWLTTHVARLRARYLLKIRP